MPFEKIDVPLLRNCELKSPASKTPCHYYVGQLTVTVAADQWTPIPSREVFSRPIAGSEPLIWARSAVTGQLFVRLQTRQHHTQKMLLRYAFAAMKVTSHLQTWRHQKLPIPIRDAFTALSKNEKILAYFPKFRQFITDMQSAENDQTRYARIKRYCQMDPASGFTDAPFDKKASLAVLEFMGTLRLKDVNTRTDLHSIFNTLLQQKGVCGDITRCAKLLCGYYGEIPCHIGLSVTHAFLNWSYREKDKFITSTTDLGGGKAQVTCRPLAHLPAEIKTSLRPAEEYTTDLKPKHHSEAEEYTADLEDKHQSELEKHKAQVIAQALIEFKSVISDGEDSRNLTEYWRLLLSCPNPLIYFPKSADMQKALAALRLYALEQLGFAPRQLFYINDPEQLSSWWETVHIGGHQLEIVPGWLQQFLLEKIPRILVLNLDKFKPYDLASNQGIGDKQRTLQNLILPEHIQVICFAPLELAREDIFLSRFTEVAWREDLFSAAEPIPYLWPTPAEEKTPAPEVMHLYGDSRLISNCLGVPELEGDRPAFSPGPLARAMTEKHNLLLTDVPEKLHSLLFLAAFRRQAMVNGIPQEFPDIKIYHGQHAQPDSPYIRFVDDIKSIVSPFYLNPHYYPLLVKGRRRIDPETGYSYSSPALLLTDELPGVIVVTRSLLYSEWRRLIDVVNQRQKPVSLYLCPGVRIAGTEYAAPLPEEINISEEFKTLPDRSGVIESTEPERTLAELQKHHDFCADDVVTLTPSVGLELLELISRKGNNFLLNYKPGWLLSRLRTEKTITILMGDMTPSLFNALESLFSPASYLYTNNGRELFLDECSG